eukprot:1775577-Rhodomonas_salina.1
MTAMPRTTLTSLSSSASRPDRPLLLAAPVSGFTAACSALLRSVRSGEQVQSKSACARAGARAKHAEREGARPAVHLADDGAVVEEVAAGHGCADARRAWQP